MNDTKIGFIGAGNMATALVRGLLASHAAQRDDIRAADVDTARANALSEELGVITTNDNAAVAKWANVLVLAVKPQAMATALEEIRSSVGPDTLIVSIAAGTPTQTIEQAFAAPVRVVRAMPNTPALVGAGATAVAPGTHATEQDVASAAALFAAVGLCVQVSESQMNAVTGLSGSGPAYVMLAIEALADGGVKCGLTRETALKLAEQTVFGSAKLALETQEHPGVLKDRVASPAGTTIAGLHSLERSGFRAALINAVEAATERSRELGG